jgi:hypothetical protein
MVNTCACRTRLVCNFTVCGSTRLAEVQDYKYKMATFHARA